DGPMTGVVYTGRHLVRDQLSGADEEFDRQYPGIAEMPQNPAQVVRGEPVPAGGAVRCACQTQDPLRMDVPVEGVDGDLPAGAAGADDGNLAVEGNQLFVEQWGGPQRAPGVRNVFRGPDHRLTLAIVSQPACLDDRGQPDVTQGSGELG